MLRTIFSAIKALNSDEHPWQISLAVVLAAFIGLTPTLSVHNFFILFLVFLLNVNFSIFFTFFLLFTIASFPLDPLFNNIGLLVLNVSSLEGLFTAMYNSTFWRLLYFNNSIIMGSFVFCLIMAVPLFFISQFVVKKYRTVIMEKLNKIGIVRAIKASKIYNIYNSVTSITK